MIGNDWDRKSSGRQHIIFDDCYVWKWKQELLWLAKLKICLALLSHSSSLRKLEKAIRQLSVIVRRAPPIHSFVKDFLLCFWISFGIGSLVGWLLAGWLAGWQ